MKSVYEDSVKAICKIYSLEGLPQAEREGAFGVACVLAYFNGVNANPYNLAKHLNVNVKDIEVPFMRLVVNGIFSTRKALEKDEILLGTAPDLNIMLGSQPYNVTSESRMRNAWCWISGISSGFCGLEED